MLMCLSMLCLILAAIPALAATQALEITRYTVDGGGGFSKGGAYSLGGTLGQPDAGLLSGGVYTLAGGFWNEALPGTPQPRLYLPLVSH